MGSGSAALLWYACCCSLVAFIGILSIGLTVYGRTRRERVRTLTATPLAPLDDLGAAGVTGDADYEPEPDQHGTQGPEPHFGSEVHSGESDAIDPERRD